MYNPTLYQPPYNNPPPQPIPTNKLPSSINSINLNLKNPHLDELKSILQQKLKKSTSTITNKNQQKNSSSSVYPLTKQKLFNPPAKAYFILNSLYQSFKKKNQFKLLQQKVHKIQVYHPQRQEHKIVDQTEGEGIQERVKPHVIFSSHQAELVGQEIIKFIEIQEFIKPGVKNQLLNEVLKAISNLNNVKDIMKCYQKLFSTKNCRQNSQLKQLAQQKMVKKIFSLDFTALQSQDKKLKCFQQIGKSLLGFPSISQNILYFIGLLFDKIQNNLQEYNFLYKIMRNNFTFKIDNMTEIMTNLKYKKQVEALLKVNNKQNIDLIKSLLKSYTRFREKNPTIDQSSIINVLRIAQTEAKYKLMKLSIVQNAVKSIPSPLNNLLKLQDGLQYPQQTIKIQQKTQQQLTQKSIYTLKFIMQVVKAGSNLWQQLNEWFKTTKSPKLKQYILTQISSFLQKSLNDQKKFKNYIIPHIKIIYQKIQETSQIYKALLKILLSSKVQTETQTNGHSSKNIQNKDTTINNMKQKSLKFLIIKKFIIKGIMNSSNLSIYIQDIFSSTLRHTQILYDMFKLQKQKVFGFYKEIIENETYVKQLYVFFQALKEKNPVKFKQWFINFDQLKGGDLFACSRYTLIEYLKNNMKVEIAFNWIRDLGMYIPSKYLVWNLMSLVSVLKSKKQYPAIKNCIAKTLNIILIRTPVNKLCDQFKKHLPNLVQQFKDSQQMGIIFNDVRAQTTNQLKKAHQQSKSTGF